MISLHFHVFFYSVQSSAWFVNWLRPYVLATIKYTVMHSKVDQVLLLWLTRTQLTAAI